MEDDKPKEKGGAKKKVSLKLDDIYEPIVAKVSTTTLLYFMSINYELSCRIRIHSHCS